MKRSALVLPLTGPKSEPASPIVAPHVNDFLNDLLKKYFSFRSDYFGRASFPLSHTIFIQLSCIMFMQCNKVALYFVLQGT
jgi:hypothetical protein